MLLDVAFGSTPGLTPLPDTADPTGRWLRAVALGGQGRYAQARAVLEDIQRTPGIDRALASSAASTRASLLRQLGRHAVAAGHDGAALALVGTGDPGGLRWHEARCDALTGLAADALGCGRLALGERLLQRCAGYLADVGDEGALWRQHVRLDWVSAEIALASGDFVTATRHTDAAVARSADSPSVRHRIKSALLSAAAATGLATPDRAIETAEGVLAESGTHGLLPLRWAAAMLLDGVRPDPAVRVVRDECAAEIARRGGRFAN
ncbi:hypothetical protein C8K36_101537 [Rhodococcus sp. OK519]|uniref:hypothetical protein n=1 Tax=Rhodococcus sp. OK519 TaxID=2135729 RepID=UPI000D3474E1|nr:hypothetical protein C8K36_101537 [Rhodococcus sp. OK519]